MLVIEVVSVEVLGTVIVSSVVSVSIDEVASDGSTIVEVIDDEASVEMTSVDEASVGKKLVEEAPVDEVVVVIIVVVVEVITAPVDASVELIVGPIVEAALANTIGGAFSPATTIAESDKSSAPALTAPMPFLSLHWLLIATVSKVTATQKLPAGPELYASQAAIHSAKLVPLTLKRSNPVRAVLQRIRYPALTV